MWQPFPTKVVLRVTVAYFRKTKLSETPGKWQKGFIILYADYGYANYFYR